MLAEFDKENNFISFKDKIILESKEKEENFENITELHDIEYALYFSFNHILTLVKNYDISWYEGNRVITLKQRNYTRDELISDMEDAIENIFDVYNNVMYDDNNERIYNMLEHLDELIFRKKYDLKYYKTYYKMIDYFDYLCSGFTAFYDASIKFHNINMGITESEDESDPGTESDPDSDTVLNETENDVDKKED
jgi:hypothetical protein